MADKPSIQRDKDDPAHDLVLMRRVHDGDESAFRTLYEAHRVHVLNFFHGLCRNHSISNDLTQETFLRIWKFRERYAATGAFKSYLFGFARNVWLEQCRRRRKQFQIELSATGARDLERLLGSEAYAPDHVAGCSEMEEHLLGALDRLPDEQRMVFMLRHQRGLSTKDIAVALQCPVNTVRSRYLLALKKLRATLSPLYGRKEVER
jgi:RNA polymerase sigma-70 factor (ECF subfamily)